MSIHKTNITDMDKVAPLIAKFRVELQALCYINANENIEAAKEEFVQYIDAGFPIFVYEKCGQYVGYLVCRVDIPTVWVESLYVLNEYRRTGIASELFDAAEQIAVSYGEDTMYNYVHPNNDGMIAFLKKKGYSVLNLIEIRKKHEDEIINEQITIRNNTFDY